VNPTVTELSSRTADLGQPPGDSPKLLRGLLVTLVVAALAAGTVLAVRWSARDGAGVPSVAAAATGAGAGDAAPAPAPAPSVYVPPSSPAIEQAWGIRIIGAQVAAAGGLVLLRYQVLDDSVGGPLHATDNSGVPEIWSEDEQGHVSTVVMGHNHYYGNGQVDGRTFVMIYGNSQGLLSAGDLVMVRMADGLELTHLLMQT
jgi:hypothetical protein